MNRVGPGSSTGEDVLVSSRVWAREPARGVLASVVFGVFVKSRVDQLAPSV
jgi:hypothetical protein